LTVGNGIVLVISAIQNFNGEEDDVTSTGHKGMSNYSYRLNNETYVSGSWMLWSLMGCIVRMGSSELQRAICRRYIGCTTVGTGAPGIPMPNTANTLETSARVIATWPGFGGTIKGAKEDKGRSRDVRFESCARGV
jgi:hypothetical protein